MRYLLDTNIISELRKGDRANAGVRDWFDSTDSDDLAISVLVLGEIRLGIMRLRRRDPTAADRLEDWSTRLRAAYRHRTFPVDGAVMEEWARLNLERPLPVIDSIQAATAAVHELMFVTRNVGDLDGIDVPLHNPFSD